MKTRQTILIVDDEQTARYGMRKALGESHNILEAASLAAAEQVLSTHSPSIILLDLNLGGEDGMQLLEKSRTEATPPVVIIITAHGNEQVAVQAMKGGAFDYVAKPFEVDELRLVVRNALDQVSLRNENRALREALDAASGFGQLIGSSTGMQRVYSLIDKVAETDVTVLLTGESGCGKELVARELHRRSARTDNELVTINCAAIPENLIESELFGHERGSFTGALQQRIGKFEKAHGGTIFLDEIGDMPIETQAKILRVLEERTIERLGSNRPIPVDVRVLSATNRDLKQMVEDGTFREDLYYRLEVIVIDIPPLRKRREDIPLLVNHFIDVFAAKHRREVPTLSNGAISALAKFDYPGNVRQLRNLLERLLLLCEENQIEESDLPPEIRVFDPKLGSKALAAGVSGLMELSFKEARESFERQYLLAKLAEHSNNISQTAASIGLHRQSLQQKIKEHDLKNFMV